MRGRYCLNASQTVWDERFVLITPNDNVQHITVLKGLAKDDIAFVTAQPSVPNRPERLPETLTHDARGDVSPHARRVSHACRPRGSWLCIGSSPAP